MSNVKKSEAKSGAKSEAKSGAKKSKAKKNAGKNSKDLPYVLVTDVHRGVYFGYLVEERDDGHTVKLEQMRHVFYMETTGDPENSGVYSLATIGPQEGSKLGPPVTAIVHHVAKVVEVQEEAREKAEAATWGTR